jgi:hypothetical protein
MMFNNTNAPTTAPTIAPMCASFELGEVWTGEVWTAVVEPGAEVLAALPGVLTPLPGIPVVMPLVPEAVGEGELVVAGLDPPEPNWVRGSLDVLTTNSVE